MYFRPFIGVIYVTPFITIVGPEPHLVGLVIMASQHKWLIRHKGTQTIHGTIVVLPTNLPCGVSIYHTW